MEELLGVQDRQCKSKRFIVFQTVILQQTQNVTASRILVDETFCTLAQYLTAACREESEEHRASTFHILVIQ